MANYTSTQRFVKLTSYLLLEYEYTTSPNPEIYYVNSGIPTVGFEKIVNGYFNNSVQILNRPQDQLITNNVRDLSVVQVEKNRFVTLNSNHLTNYLDTDPKLTSVANLPVVFQSNIGVHYDTVKLHIVSGYSFDNLDGIIVQIKFQERTGKKATISQLIIKRGDIDLPILNPNPIYLGGALYDHYIQIKIPAYANMCYEFDALNGSPAQAETLAAKISSDGKGFLKDAPVEFVIYEISQTFLKNRFENYIAQMRAQLGIFPRDNYGSLAATIQENTRYNYLEYFPTWEGNFLEDFIYAEGKVGNSYYVINEIEVKEQVGLSYITTHSFTSIQDKNFNAPNIFRPVLINPSATSFIVNYTMRLVNKNNQNQIIRRASFNSFNVNKYGRENNVITLATGAYAQKVYNKIIQPPNVISPNGANTRPPSPPERKVPIFYKDNHILITKENIFIDKNGNLISEVTSSDSIQIYGQGKAKIVVDPFDNFYKFTVYNLIDKSLHILDLGTSLNYYLVFTDKSGRSVRVENIKNQTSISNPAAGQIAFKVVKSNSKKILEFTSRDFYIISVGPDGTETKLYHGTWQTPSEYAASNQHQHLPGKGSSAISTVSQSKTEIHEVKPKPFADPLIGEQIISNAPTTNIMRPTAPYPIGGSSILSITPTSHLKSPSKANQGNQADIRGNTVSQVINNINNNLAALSNSILVALSNSIAGMEAQGLSIQNIINYYFTPGAPGSSIFKGITVGQFLYSVLQIHPKSSSGDFDPKYVQYCNALKFPVSDDPIAEEAKTRGKNQKNIF